MAAPVPQEGLSWPPVRNLSVTTPLNASGSLIESVGVSSLLEEDEDLAVSAQTFYHAESVACDFLGMNLVPFTGQRVFKSSAVKNDVVVQHRLHYVLCLLGTAVQRGSVSISRKEGMAFNHMFNAIRYQRAITFENGTSVLEKYQGLTNPRRSSKLLTKAKDIIVDTWDDMRDIHLSKDWYFNYKSTISRQYELALRSFNNKTLAAEVYYAPRNMKYFSYARYPQFKSRRITTYVPHQTVGAQYRCTPTPAQLAQLIALFEYSKIGGVFDGDFECDPATATIESPLVADEFWKIDLGWVVPFEPLTALKGGGPGLQFEVHFNSPLVHTPHPLDPRFFSRSWKKGLHVNEDYTFTGLQLAALREYENEMLNQVNDFFNYLLLPDQYVPFEADFWRALTGDLPWVHLTKGLDAAIGSVLPGKYKAVFDRWLETITTSWYQFPMNYDIDTFLSLLIRNVPFEAASQYRKVWESKALAFQQKFAGTASRPWWGFGSVEG